ncbi:MAG TPA: hypothetical protein VKH46_01805 [Thermoanaerobaculia bacterium]|nr:hypothetical protein [Thermoanaerobaculia bacterium]
MDQVVHVSTADLVNRISEQPFGGRVDVDDAALDVQLIDPLTDARKHGVQAGGVAMGFLGVAPGAFFALEYPTLSFDQDALLGREIDACVLCLIEGSAEILVAPLDVLLHPVERRGDPGDLVLALHRHRTVFASPGRIDSGKEKRCAAAVAAKQRGGTGEEEQRKSSRRAPKDQAQLRFRACRCPKVFGEPSAFEALQVLEPGP